MEPLSGFVVLMVEVRPSARYAPRILLTRMLLTLFTAIQQMRVKWRQSRGKLAGRVEMRTWWRVGSPAR